MWIADGWKEYLVLDTGDGEKLERWGDYTLVRPDPQVIWGCDHAHPAWKTWQGHYHRSEKGGGEWEFRNLPEQWSISYRLHALSDLTGADRMLTFHLKPFAFKHTGLFPEQAANWEWFTPLIAEKIRSFREAGSDREFKVLNLFAYTGGATIAAAAAGAFVTHVDASKGMVTWAKENAQSSGIAPDRIRWLVDDCGKLVEREIRRGNRYDAIIMDPPSYGRGPKGELWKLEESLWPFLENAVRLLSDDASFFLLNSYTTGLQPGGLRYMLSTLLSGRGMEVEAEEIGLPLAEPGDALRILPCGAAGRARSIQTRSK